MWRPVLLCLAGLWLAACTNPNDLDRPAAALGDFELGHNIVVASKMTKGPLSRDATEKEWVDALTDAMDERFGRYDGGRFYHLGISVEGYVIAVSGVPVVAAPKSVLILNVNVWDDAAGQKMTRKPERITVVEAISADSVVGSGITQTKEEQIENLARTAAKRVELYLLKQKKDKGWFQTKARTPKPAAPKPAAQRPASATPDKPASKPAATRATAQPAKPGAETVSEDS